MCLLTAVAMPLAADPGDLVALAGGTTELVVNGHLLADLGISIAPAQEAPATRVFPILDGPTLLLELPSGSYRGPASGHLLHHGGFELAWSHGHVSLVGFELHAGLPPDAFELRATDGSVVFVLDNPHPQRSVTGEEFLFLDLDLRFSEQMASRLGRPEMARLAVGEAHVRTRIAAGSSEDGSEWSQTTSAPIPGGGTCIADFSGPVDVRLESMTSVSEIHHDGQHVALAPAVTLRNVGGADIPWYRSIAPDGLPPLDVVGEHPFLVMHLYRLAGGRLEQIGRSDLKHAFFSGNTPPCDCQPDQILFKDCTDLYGASTNANRRYLAPRSEITASTGAWTRTGSHFDGPPPDDLRGHDESDHVDPFEHRLTARVADLQTAGAEYRVEAWYLVRDDIDIYNSMGHRAVVPTLPTPWTFPFSDLGLTRGSVLDTWVDPVAPPAGASNTTIATSGPAEGQLKLAVTSTPLPSGLYHYEYALMNFDFDRAIDLVSVPIPAGVTVQNLWFGDGDSIPTNDWPASSTAGSVDWTAPAGNELDWGTLFNFSFDADASPLTGVVTLGVRDAGSPMALTGSAVVPGSLIPFFEIEVVRTGSGSGLVTSTPEGLDCGSDCAEILANGTSIDLSAVASAGSAFERWEEDGMFLSWDRTTTVTIDGHRDLTAVFETCQNDVLLPPQVVASAALFHACERLEAGNGFEVAAEVIFRAGREIVLGEGFGIQAGSSFRAEIAPEQSGVP